MRIRHAILALLLCFPGVALADYDSLLSDGNLVTHLPCEDNAASATVTNTVTTDASIAAGGPNTSDISTTGPNAWQTLAFDCDDERIDFAANLQFTADFTVAFWANRTDTSASDSVVATVSTDRVIFPADDTNVRLIIDGTNYDLTHGVTSTNWHHYVVIYRAADDTIDLIVDGSEADVDNAGPSSLDFNLIRAAMTSSSTQPFGGQLSDIFIFDRDLSLSEAQDLHAGPSSGPAIPLIHYYRQQMGR